MTLDKNWYWEYQFSQKRTVSPLLWAGRNSSIDSVDQCGLGRVLSKLPCFIFTILTCSATSERVFSVYGQSLEEEAHYWNHSQRSMYLYKGRHMCNKNGWNFSKLWVRVDTHSVFGGSRITKTVLRSSLIGSSRFSDVPAKDGRWQH